MTIIDLSNPFESAPEAGRPAAAAFVPQPGAAAVGTSSPEVMATIAPGMARDEIESRAKVTEGKAAITGMAQKSPAPTGLRVGEPARTGELSWPALGRTSNVSERGVTAGETAPNSSSGDGLGIHEPGSMTWGGDTVATAPSGRADESAKCPAVTGSISDIIDIPAFLQRNPDNTFRFPVTSEA